MPESGQPVSLKPLRPLSTQPDVKAADETSYKQTFAQLTALRLLSTHCRRSRPRAASSEADVRSGWIGMAANDPKQTFALT